MSGYEMNILSVGLCLVYGLAYGAHKGNFGFDF